MPVVASGARPTTPKRIELALPEFALPAVLPHDRAALEALIQAQQQALDETRAQAQRHIDFLYEQFVLYRHRLFGASSEQLPGQGWLFDEAEVLAARDAALAKAAEETQAANGAASDSAPPAHQARGKRLPLPAELPRVDIVHEVPESERTCPCGTPMRVIGEEVSEQLDIVPMRIQVLRHIRKRYGCPDSAHAPVTAALPAQPLPRSNASPDLLAMLLTVKYVDGLPLARFEQVLARSGVTVPRQTLARWVIGTAKLLQPLHNLMRDALFDGPLVHMDETTVQVLKEPGRAATAGSYMWVQTGGPPDKPVVIYDYDPSRSGEVPQRLLAGYRGYLMTDGYEGYNALARGEGVRHMTCWAHARRAVIEAQRVQPTGKRGRADHVLEMIGRLYGIERGLVGLDEAQRLAQRRAHSVPVLETLRGWLDAHLPLVAPRSALGRALAYLHKYWPKLVRYVESGALPIDNNRAENAIRPFVVGRKAWLFSDTPAGAHASALIYSLVETAKANGVEPFTWLSKVLRALPAAQTVDAIEALLPWNLHRAD